MSRREQRDREFAAYAAARSAQLQRTAFLLCGDRHRAEDLVQITLTKLYLAWDRVEKRGALDGYTRQILVRASIDESRKPWRKREISAAEHMAFDSLVTDQGDSATDSPVFDELRRLPTRQRTAVVLRYWNDLSVEETARLMECSTNAVKTHSSRGLAKLRAALPTDLRNEEASHE